MANRTKLTDKKKAAFLAEVERGAGNISSACRRLRLSRTIIYLQKEADQEFAAALNAAVDRGVDVLEDEARRRAFNGTTVPVYHNGKKVGERREYSDFLMGLMLKAHRKKYVERQEHTGPDGTPLTPGTVTFVVPDNGRGGQWAPGQPAPHASTAKAKPKKGGA